MDFKVAALRWRDGIQMDIKVKGTRSRSCGRRLSRRHGSQNILVKCSRHPSPRDEMSKLAPRVHRIKINPDKIGAVIVPGGKMIRSIQDETAPRSHRGRRHRSIAADRRSPADEAIRRIKELTDEFTPQRARSSPARWSASALRRLDELVPAATARAHTELSEDRRSAWKGRGRRQPRDELSVMVTVWPQTEDQPLSPGGAARLQLSRRRRDRRVVTAIGAARAGRDATIADPAGRPRPAPQSCRTTRAPGTSLPGPRRVGGSCRYDRTSVQTYGQRPHDVCPYG